MKFLGKLFLYGVILVAVSFALPSSNTSLLTFLRETTFIELADEVFEAGLILLAVFLGLSFLYAILLK